jgi:hypothetical protein
MYKISIALTNMIETKIILQEMGTTLYYTFYLH